MLSPLRRQTAFASTALVLAAVLSSCGFDPATDRENNIAVGVTDREGTMGVLAATVVAAESGEAVLVAGLTNKSRSEEDALVQVISESETIEPQEGEEAEPVQQGVVTVGEFEPITVGPLGFVQLIDTDTPVTIEGIEGVGGHLDLMLVFESGERLSVNPPIVRNCGPYAEVPGLPAGDEVCDTAEDEAH